MERENYMEQNPYDILIEPANEPVVSPVIFSATEQTISQTCSEETVELQPLSSQVLYTGLMTKEYTSEHIHNFEVEAELLVPDTEPDMDMILNVTSRLSGIRPVEKENGSYNAAGEVCMEIMYRSRDAYGEPVRIINSTSEFIRPLENVTGPAGSVIIRGSIIKNDYRIINERKYKVKVQVQLATRTMKECERNMFEGIKDYPLYLKKEKINFPDFSGRKKSAGDIDSELLINDEKIRPVKIMKAEFSVCENHRQITKDKLILGETIWVRIMYMAEVASMGNLHNQPMLYQGRIDETRFIPLPEPGCVVAVAGVNLSADQLTAEINSPCTGFIIKGTVYTEADFITFKEQEVVTDFYHAIKDIICDYQNEEVCSDITPVALNHAITDYVTVENDNDMRIIYTDGSILECGLEFSGTTLTMQGKVQVEAVTINQGNYTTFAKKVCSFSCSTEVGETAVPGKAVLESVAIKEITANISENKIDFNVQLIINVNVHHQSIYTSISNPCIIERSTPEKHYPITVHTVKEDENCWDIAKRYKVSPDSLGLINGPDCIRPGNKIVIVK